MTDDKKTTIGVSKETLGLLNEAKNKANFDPSKKPPSDDKFLKELLLEKLSSISG